MVIWKKILKKTAIILLRIGYNAVFKAIDLDNDGKISKEEIRKKILRITRR